MGPNVVTHFRVTGARDLLQRSRENAWLAVKGLMAKQGFQEEEIKGIGRWSSDAFLKYVKSGRLVRSRFSEKLAAAVRNEMSF